MATKQDVINAIADVATASAAARAALLAQHRHGLGTVHAGVMARADASLAVAVAALDALDATITDADTAADGLP